MNKTWSDISIKTYFDIIDIAKDDKDDGLTKDVKLIATIFNLNAEDVWDLPVNEVNEYREAIEFISTPPTPKKLNLNKISVNGKKCKVFNNLNDFTYAQYVDFQQYWRKEDNLLDVLSVLVVPEGEKYGKYDVEAFKQEIAEYMSVDLATSICSFFLKSLADYLNNSLQYLEKKVKMLKNLPVKATAEEKKQIREAMEKIREIQYIVGSRS